MLRDTFGLHLFLFENKKKNQTPKWPGGFVCRPTGRAEVWQCSLSRYEREKKGGREGEREGLAYHDSWRWFGYRETRKLHLPTTKLNSCYNTYCFSHFLNNLCQSESTSLATNVWVWCFVSWQESTTSLGIDGLFVVFNRSFAKFYPHVNQVSDSSMDVYFCLYILYLPFWTVFQTAVVYFKLYAFVEGPKYVPGYSRGYTFRQHI